MKVPGFLLAAAVLVGCPPQAPAEADALAARLVRIMKENYDRRYAPSLGEALVHRLGRSTYFQALDLWLVYRGRIEEAPVPRNAAVERLVEAVEPCLPPTEVAAFRASFERLFRISLRNFEMYHAAVSEARPGDVETLTSEDVRRCLDTPKYRRMQDRLYEEERAIRGEIRRVLAGSCARRRAGLYTLVYDFLDRQREKAIARLRGGGKG